MNKMDNVIKYIQQLPIYNHSLNNRDNYIQYIFNILNQKFNFILLLQNKQLTFFQVNNFNYDKLIYRFNIYHFQNDYFLIQYNDFISLITEKDLLLDFQHTKYFTFQVFNSRTKLSKYFAKLTNQNKDEIKEKIKIFIPD